MNLREAAQQALDAMELHLQWHESGCVYLEPAVTSLRAALAKQRPKPDSMKDVYASLRKKAMRSRL